MSSFLTRVAGALALATAFVASPAGSQTRSLPLQVRPARVLSLVPTWDFERGNLQGWTPSGNAFQHQPTCGDNSALRGAGPSNLQGKYWIGTFESYRCRAGELGGASQGDRPTGTLTSSAFTVRARYVGFLVGGGGSVETRVQLVAALAPDPDNPVDKLNLPAPARGQDSEAMRRVYWEVAHLMGAQVRVRIVDLATGTWGHINADDFQFVDQVPAGAEVLGRPATKQLVQVPPVAGMSLVNALAALRNANLREGAIAVRGGRAELRRDWVIAQYPAAHASVPPGSGVDLVLDAWAVVPDVADQPVAAALQMIAEEGLRPDKPRLVGDATLQDGRVTAQWPAAGTRVLLGSVVRVTASSPAIDSPPEDTPRPIRTIAVAAGAAAAGLAGVAAAAFTRQWRRRRPRAEHERAPDAPRFDVRPRHHPERDRVDLDLGSTPPMRWTLKPHVDPGIQSVSPPALPKDEESRDETR